MTFETSDPEPAQETRPHSFESDIARPLEVIYGPVIIAAIFAYAINLDQSLEVINATHLDFGTGTHLDFGSGTAEIGAKNACTGFRTCLQWLANNGIDFLHAAFRVFILATVPMATITASRWALQTAGYPLTGKHLLLPRFFAALAWGAYILSLLLALGLVGKGVGNNDMPSQAGTVFRFFITTFFFTLFIALQLAIAPQMRVAGEAVGRGRALASRGLLVAGGVFVFLNIFWPEWAICVGPVAVSGGMFAIMIYGMAGLTVLSMTTSFIKIPLILVLCWLALVTSGPEGALLSAGAVVAFGIGNMFGEAIPSLRRVKILRAVRAVALSFLMFCKRIVGLRPLRIEAWGITIFALSLAVWALHHVFAQCHTLSGCNLVYGEEIRHSEGAWESPHAFLSERKAPRELTMVAAQGGGLYAAFHSAQYLAAVSDLDADAARSLFALSGVSGGSIGAGAFWAVRASGFCQLGPLPDGTENTCHRDAIEQILDRDYLSPILATLYTRDLIDTFIPISAVATLFGKRIDRGAVFETALDRAYRSWFDDRWDEASQLGKPLPDRDLRHVLDWTVADTARLRPDLPLLIFNAVDVDSGELIVMSPLRDLGTGRPGRIDLPQNQDLTVAQAMVASARYPLITPPLWIFEANTVGRQIADGGYFDNSGLESLWFVIDDLRRNGDLDSSAAGHPVNVVALEVIDCVTGQTTGSGETSAAEGCDAQATSNTQDASADKAADIQRDMHGAIGAPISAFLGSWRSRRELLMLRFKDFANRDDMVSLCYAPMTRNEGLVENFTLSWFLSRQSLDKISKDMSALVSESEFPGRCRTNRN